MSGIDLKDLRNALGAYPTGVTVVTAVNDEAEPVGFTANSFTSVSLDPPLLLVCLAHTLTSFQVFEQCERFAVNVLAEGQEEIANIFARYAGNRFEKIDWQAGPSDLPVIEGVAAAFSCRTENVVPAGDHVILIGEVEHFTHAGPRGLGYVAGRYFSLGLEQATAIATPTGRVSYVGAIVCVGDRVLLMPGDDGWSVPKIQIDGSAAIRTTLTDWFAASGTQVLLRRTYSIFDGPGGTHFTYFLADGAPSDSSTGYFVPLSEIKALSIASEAERSMLNRFVRETEVQDYGFYVGDSETGYVHAISNDD